jgi:hypothetical protein
MNKLPERINVMKVVTYDPRYIAECIAELDGISVDEVSIENVLDYVQGWVDEDFGTEHTLIWQDENGNDL